MAEEDLDLRIRIARARLLAAEPDKGGGGTTVAEPPPGRPRPTYPTDTGGRASPETLAIWGGGDPAEAPFVPPEVRFRRMGSAVSEEGRKILLRQVYEGMHPRERGAAARSINQSLGEGRTVHQMDPIEIALEHERLRGTERSPVLTEAGRTAMDFLESTAKVPGAAWNLLMGDPEQARIALTPRKPGTEERTPVFREETSEDPLIRSVGTLQRVAVDPLTWFGFGGGTTAARSVGMAGKGLAAEEVAALRASRGPMTAVEIQGFRDVREEALAALRRVREERQVGRIASHVEPVPSIGEIAGSARSDEAAEALRRLGASGEEMTAALQEMESGRLGRRFGTGPVPPETPPSIVIPGEAAPPPAGGIEIPAVVKGSGLPPGVTEEAAQRADALATVGARVRVAGGKEGVVKGVQPNGNLIVSVEGGRPGLMSPDDVELLNRGALVPDPIPESANAPIGTYPLARSETGLKTIPEPVAGPPGPLGATEKPPTMGAPVGAKASHAAPSVPPGALPELAGNPAVPHPAWTAAVDRVTDGLGSWLDSTFPRAAQALRAATAKTPFHATDRELGALHESYLSNLGSLRGEAADVLGPAEKALGKATPTAEETEAFFRYASNRSAEVPQIVKDNPEVGRALDWYNRVLRPRLVESGALSKEALGEFDRYLPNILTAQLEKPGRRSFAFTGSPRTSLPRLRQNFPGAVLENVTKDEAQALADSIKGATGEPVVVGPYGRNSYIKYATEADRDAFLKALDNERRGAGLKTGKIRYRAFEKIPDEWLEKSVEEGGGGLVKDPMGLLAHAMDRGTKEIAARSFYERLAAHPAVLDLEHGVDAAKGYAAIPDTPRWGALRGKQVPKAWKDALTQGEASDTDTLSRWWKGTIRAFKKNVITQTATAARNGFYDANTLAVYNHMSPGSGAWWRNLGRAKDAFSEWHKSGVRPEAVRSFQEAGGFLNGDALSSEALDRLNALLKAQKEGKVTVEQAAEEFTHLTTGSPFALQGAEDVSGLKSAVRSVAGGVTAGARSLAQGEGLGAAAVEAATGAGQTMALGKAGKALERVYQGTDDFFKVAYYENWRDIFRKKFPDLSPAEVNRLAASEVNARSQIVHFKSPIARELTDSGIQPFAWWWDQKVRIESYMARQDPVRFMVGQAQGSAGKVVAGTAVAALSGIPVAELWDWMKRNPGSMPLSAHKDERGKWIVVGARYQAALPDPVAATWASISDPETAGREAADSLAFSNPVASFAAKGGALLHGGVKATDPTFGENRRLVEPGETPAAAALRLYFQSFGSPIAPEGRQSQDVRALAEGDTMKGKSQPRTVGRTISGLAGATVSESPAAGAEFAGRRYAAEQREAQGWLRDAMKDPDAKRLSPDHPERRRLFAEYEDMILDAYEEVLQDGARFPPPDVRTPEGAEKLKAILAHHGAR